MQERQFAVLGIQALLMEGDFIDEALDFRIANGGAPMPASFRAKMLKAMEKSVSEFMSEVEGA